MPRSAGSRPSAPRPSWGSGQGSKGGRVGPGLSVEIGREAVVVRWPLLLRVLSSAVVGGGLAEARAVINLHVAKDDPWVAPPGLIGTFARRAAVNEPYVGLLTSAWTEHATVGEAAGFGFQAVAVATGGLSHRVAAGGGGG